MCRYILLINVPLYSPLSSLSLSLSLSLSVCLCPTLPSYLIIHKCSLDFFRYIAYIADAAKRSPELIQLLDLHMQFSTITPYGKSAEPGHMIEKPLTKRDSGIQTEVRE